jgi:hypothetical protein
MGVQGETYAGNEATLSYFAKPKFVQEACESREGRG